MMTKVWPMILSMCVQSLCGSEMLSSIRDRICFCGAGGGADGTSGSGGVDGDGSNGNSGVGGSVVYRSIEG